ncbi:hypothetical protein ACYF6T_33225 [Streptomyces sp. 7R007]
MAPNRAAERKGEVAGADETAAKTGQAQPLTITRAVRGLTAATQRGGAPGTWAVRQARTLPGLAAADEWMVTEDDDRDAGPSSGDLV